MKPNIIRELVLLDQTPNETELGFTGRRETSFNLLEPTLDEAIKLTN